LFEFIESVFRKKHYHEGIGHEAKRKAAIAKFSHDIDQLEKAVSGGRDTSVRSKEFFLLVKSAFREAMDLKYQATFQEIWKEIDTKKRYTPALRDELKEFLETLTTMEYGYPYFKAVVEEKTYEREHQLAKYIKDLELEGEHIRKETKKKISELVAETMPHSDRELLQRNVSEFKAIMHKIF